MKSFDLDTTFFGLRCVGDKDKNIGLYEVVQHAIDVGYRYFETAHLHWNEEVVGKAISDKIADGTVRREDIFLVNKIWCTLQEPYEIEMACRDSLKRLNMDYIDLFVLHVPTIFKYHCDEVLFPLRKVKYIDLEDLDYVNAWKSMINIRNLGLAKHVGTSNFDRRRFDRLLVYPTNSYPISNKIEFNPCFNQKRLIKYCQANHILLTANYDPTILSHMESLDKTVANMISKYKKTLDQIILKYMKQMGVHPIIDTTDISKIAPCLDTLDFELNSDEIEEIENLYRRLKKLVERKNVEEHFPIRQVDLEILLA